MKTHQTAIAAVLVGLMAFFAGRLSSGKSRDQEPFAATESPAGKASIRSTSRSTSAAGKPTVEGRPMTLVADHALTVEQARELSSEERMALISRGAMSWNSGNQMALLSGVIAALTKEEIGPATDILGGIQDRGNFQTQEVWDALWTQWGRVDPVKALGFFADDHSGKSKSDARHMMTGWLETDPLAAFAWAKQPKQSGLEAAAAALAITRNANGDPKRMQASILALPADDLTRSACLQDYFDLTSMAGEGQGAATTYDQLPSTLREAAWPVAMQRLAYEDPQAAATWLQTHAADPGRDYAAVHDFVGELARRDPATTVEWTLKLPGLEGGISSRRQVHPAEIAIHTWLREDPPAAKAWLESHATEAPWAQPFLKGE